ncbi:macro domain-containing protein [Peptoniphilus sp. MSJ-1]|uniref:Macro domain-containing protein n=1 Tax=Peptoniphilus ovalis TaxID=2841503 RepID=A0ABS6FE18_9FIRM|nr:macro domain-containing protein [Peptoniphilus ovalis]MBU5668410.1 macro domain-containing protein [Peptoniphilus ovalis]
MPFKIVRDDITKISVDAIVNTVSGDLSEIGGVSAAIFKAAGFEKLKKACEKLFPIETSEAVITSAFNLNSKYVIHTQGPIYTKTHNGDNENLLYKSYINSMKRACENNCKSIAFPLISSGHYGFPKDEAIKVASSAIKDFIRDHDIDVYLVVYDNESFKISEKLMGDVKSYIDENYIDENILEFSNRERIYCESLDYDCQTFEFNPNLEKSFSETLLNLIDEKNMTDVEVYKRANIDRKLFSKIKNKKNYKPSKNTAIALAISLRLSLDETKNFLEIASYALSHSILFDVIIEYFLTNENYDIFEINDVLFSYNQPIL